MSRIFPTLSRGPRSWRQEKLNDPVVRKQYDCGAVQTYRVATTVLDTFFFEYRYITDADKLLLSVFEQGVGYGAEKWLFYHTKLGSNWEFRFASEPLRFVLENDYDTWKTEFQVYGKEVGKMCLTNVYVEDLAPGADISERPIFVSGEEVTLDSIGLLTEDVPAGVDDSNTVVIAVKDDAGNTVVSKTFNTGTQPPSSDYVDLGSLANVTMNAGEHLTVTMTQGATANMPAFSLPIEFHYTNADS